MNPRSMEPFGMALHAYFEGRSNAELIARRSDGSEKTLPIRLFFREFTDIGEISMQFEFRGKRGPYCGWLQIDADTLNEHAKLGGWNGDYLARLTR